MQAVLTFLPFLGLCLITASTGALFTPGKWYEDLRKPPWTPADWVFPTVWAALYLMIASAGWLVWKNGAPWSVLGLFGLQLVLNAAWSLIFFGLKRMRWALLDVCLLWLSIAACILAFLPYSVVAAALMAPYLLWVSIAATLNLRVWQMNRPSAESV